MTFSFKYKATKRFDGTTVQSPVIPITLTGRAKTKIEVIALVDSGADVSVIPEDIAKLLDLDMSKQTGIAKGIGGKAEIKNSNVTIRISNAHQSKDFSIPVQVILGETEMPAFLLGRNPFFSKFKITFDQNNLTVQLKENNEHPY